MTVAASAGGPSEPADAATQTVTPLASSGDGARHGAPFHLSEIRRSRQPGSGARHAAQKPEAAGGTLSGRAFYSGWSPRLGLGAAAAREDTALTESAVHTATLGEASNDETPAAGRGADATPEGQAPRAMYTCNNVPSAQRMRSLQPRVCEHVNGNTDKIKAHPLRRAWLHQPALQARAGIPSP